MEEITAVARPYAHAVAHLARGADNWQAWSGMLAWAAGVAADPRVATLMGVPTVAPERMARIVLAVCGERLSAEGANFVRLLAGNRRLGCLPEIARLFEEIKAGQEGVLAASIATAYPLSEAQLAGLVAKLETRFGRRVEASQEVDASLIGGVVIRVGDEVMDASMRGRLAGIAATLVG